MTQGRRRRIGWLAALLPLFLCGNALAQAPPRDRVTVEPDETLKPYTPAIQTICTYAVSQAEAMGLSLPERVTVRAAKSDHYPSFCLARGDEVLFLPHLDLDLGPGWVARLPQIGLAKVRDLLTAVLDIATRHEYPAIAEMISACYLVPALFQAQGPELWPQPYDYNAIEGREQYIPDLWSPTLQERCPELGLAALAFQVAEDHGLPVLGKALAAAVADRDPAKDALQKLADALSAATGEAGLREQVLQFRELCHVEPDENGTVLLYGFDSAADLQTWVCWESQARIVPDHATQGPGCVRWEKQGPDTAWPTLVHDLPYWKHRDWRGFSDLAVDVYNESDQPQTLLVQLYDEGRRTHGRLERTFWLPPQKSRCLVIPLRKLAPGRAGPPELEFDDTFHFDDVRGLTFVLSPQPAPVVLYLDSLRLLKLDENSAADKEAAHQRAVDLASEALDAKREGKLQEAETKAREATKLEPDDPKIHWVLAWTLVSAEKTAEAADEFRKIVELSGDQGLGPDAQAALERLRHGTLKPLP